ncbi:MAG: hypothetical protein CHACPFDD_02241 [Phycisphaerae bacterium]|nr:hypothetical protein [Phycisphaerae bacterium]
MKVDAPPINGSARQKLAWLLGILLTVILILVLGSGAMLLRHDSKIAVHETRLDGVERTLARIETKLDRLLERHP